MAIFKVTLRQSHSGGRNEVILYIDKNTVKNAYDAGVEKAIEIFGPSTESRIHYVIVEELPA